MGTDDSVHGKAQTPRACFQGACISSKLLDAFVLTHSFCAISFASAMLLMPSLFGLFITADELSPYAIDSIRWASPFVYGYGILAAVSLTMHAEDRWKVACMYALTLGMAVPIGCWVQSTGRWNQLHMLNIGLFASLSAVYTAAALKYPHSFDRREYELASFDARLKAIDESIHGKGQTALGCFQGVSLPSRLIDAFVLTHSLCAISFASAMLCMPSLFGLFITADELPAYAMDSIRWASPFVYGYGVLAAVSLTMHAEDRWKVACMYALTLGMAVPIGCWVQSTGRWNQLHILNIGLFATLSATYAVVASTYPHAFDRRDCEASLSSSLLP